MKHDLLLSPKPFCNACWDGLEMSLNVCSCIKIPPKNCVLLMISCSLYFAVFRTQGSHMVILNTLLWPEMCYDKASNKSLRMTAMNADTKKASVFLITVRRIVYKIKIHFLLLKKEVWIERPHLLNL